MKPIARALAALSLLALMPAARTAEPQDLLQSLATCGESWHDWRSDEKRMGYFASTVQANFERNDKRRVWLPRKPVQLIGHRVTELIPQSVGMGLGFSVTLDAPWQQVRTSFEKALGKPMKDCSESDGMTMCELPLAERRTAVLMTRTAAPQVGTMVGCYYFYEK